VQVVRRRTRIWSTGGTHDDWRVLELRLGCEILLLSKTLLRVYIPQRFGCPEIRLEEDQAGCLGHEVNLFSGIELRLEQTGIIGIHEEAESYDYLPLFPVYEFTKPSHKN